MNLPEISVKQPVMTLMVFLGVIMVGVFCLVQMPIDLFPEMDIPTITVMTAYDGAGPEEVEEKVTRPLEERLATVEDLKHITSTSREGLSSITLMFDWETDLESRANDIRDAIDMAKQLVAEEADDSRIFKLDVSQFPIIVYGVYADESYENLMDILEDTIGNPLESIPGVGSVQIMAPLHRQVNVELDRERLASYALTPGDVVGAIARENRDVSAGSIKMGSTDYLPRIPAEFNDVAPMNDIVVRASEGTIVRIRDVGYVVDGFKDVESDVRINGKSGAVLMVQKQSDANTVEVTRAVQKSLTRLMKQLPPDVKIVPVMDSAEDIERMVDDLLWTLIIGGGLAMLAVLIFLREIRGTFIIALTIPFSLIASGILMYMMDYSINMMTLFALIVAIGMVVDNAIVVLENITRHREEGESNKEGAIFGATEVGMAIAASTLTTICIFFPLLFIKGISKIIFVPFAIVATVVLLASLFTALTMTPMLASKLFSKPLFGDRSRGWLYRATGSMLDGIDSRYSKILGWSLRHSGLVILIIVAMFMASLVLVPAIGWEFMPKEDRGLVQGTIELPVGTRVEVTSDTMRKIEEVIAEVIPSEYTTATFVRCGASDRGMSAGSEGPHIGHFGVKLVPIGERKKNTTELAEELRRAIDRIAGQYSIVKFRLDLQDPLAGMMMGGEQPLSVNILGDDQEEAERLANILKKEIQSIPGTVDIATTREKGAPEVWVEVDRQKASSMGLNVSDVADTVRASVYGKVAGKYRVRGDEYDIFVRLQEKDRAELSDLGHVPVRLPNGELVRVENVAEVKRESGPIEIIRKDQHRIIRIEGDVHGRSLGEVISDVRKRIENVEAPRGLSVVVSGQSGDIEEAFIWLSLALLIGTALVYMIMAAQFESLMDPFVVMFSIPVAIVGVIWFLFLGGYSLNVIVFLGVLLLIGVVVNNAIVLVDYINILRARGMNMMDAVKEAGRTRLRPVLMTAITTIIALVPMAFKRGQGSEVWNPLGATIMGGLLVSTVVTLVLVPTIYSLFERKSKR